MIRGILLLADGFEETEAIATYDVLRRSGEVSTVLASISSSLEVVSSGGIRVVADGFLSQMERDAYSFLILPGGKIGVDNLKRSEEVKSWILEFAKKGKYLFAICAAPSILGELGLLDGKRYTCFPGFERGKGEYRFEGSVIDGTLVTGHSMAYSIPFGEDILRVLLGEEAVKRIQHGTKGTR